MNEEEFFEKLAYEIAVATAEAIDKEFIEAFKELSPRKKKKIHKWVFKIIKKKSRYIKPVEIEGVADYRKKQ